MPGTSRQPRLRKEPRRDFLAAAMFVLLLLTLPGLALPAAAQSGRLLVNAMEYPWSAIGRVNAGGRGFCTGFLVGERHVLSAAHCLYNFTEGRWLGAIELHFVAGYQHDTYTINSAVGSYQRAPGFNPRKAAKLAEVPNDWALLRLKKPIGLQAGWLPLAAVGKKTVARVEAGGGFFLQAGYRGDRPHAMTASLRCHFAGFLPRRLGLVHGCDVMRGDSGSPFLLFQDGRFQAVGVHSLDIEERKGAQAAVLSAAVFDATGSNGVLRAAGIARKAGGAPVAGSPAAARPITTIDRLLTILGYLHKSNTSPSDRAAAITAFERDHGLAATGQPSIALLGRLIAAIP